MAFARIVTTPCDDPVVAQRSPSHRRTRRLLVAAALAVGVTVAVVVAVSTSGPRSGGGSAYGSWEPTPVPLTEAAAGSASTTCRAALGLLDRGERVVVSERRGGWTYLVLAGPGTQATCLMPDDLVGQAVTDRGQIFGSYDSEATAPPALGPDSIVETTSRQGSTEEGWFICSEGHVGSQVTSVTVHTSSGRDIETSIAGGRFAAWWPSAEQSSEHAAETWSYTVHLADGSTRSIG